MSLKWEVHLGLLIMTRCHRPIGQIKPCLQDSDPKLSVSYLSWEWTETSETPNNWTIMLMTALIQILVILILCKIKVRFAMPLITQPKRMDLVKLGHRAGKVFPQLETSAQLHHMWAGISRIVITWIKAFTDLVDPLLWPITITSKLKRQS